MKQILKSKIAVVGGTAFDAGRGAAILKANGLNCHAIGLSANPDVQAELYKHSNELQVVFNEKVGQHDFQEIVVFCNSLSFAGPWRLLYPGRVTELTACYKDLFQKVNLAKTAILVADENTQAQMEKLAEDEGICSANELNVFARLDLILELEKANPKKQRQLILAAIEGFVEQGYSEIVFGCTHLDHSDFYNYKEAKIHQPGLDMMRDFMLNYKDRL